jgi:hypothetical protein
MSTDFDVGIPIPTAGGRPREEHTTSGDLRRMKVGDSKFYAPPLVSGVSGACSSVKRQMGFRFAMRVVTENGVRGVRVWRVKAPEVESNRPVGEHA